MSDIVRIRDGRRESLIGVGLGSGWYFVPLPVGSYTAHMPEYEIEGDLSGGTLPKLARDTLMSALGAKRANLKAKQTLVAELRAELADAEASLARSEEFIDQVSSFLGIKWEVARSEHADA